MSLYVVCRVQSPCLPWGSLSCSSVQNSVFPGLLWHSLTYFVHLVPSYNLLVFSSSSSCLNVKCPLFYLCCFFHCSPHAPKFYYHPFADGINLYFLPFPKTANNIQHFLLCSLFRCLQNLQPPKPQTEAR